MACLQPPFYEDNMQNLFSSIVYKQQKAIPQYSSAFTEFVSKMLMKKKEDRPIITDVIDYFNEKRVPCAICTVLSPLDKAHYS